MYSKKKKKSLYAINKNRFIRLTKKFKNNNHIIYKKNVFPPKIFKKIIYITNKLKSQVKLDTFTNSRYGLHVPKKSKLYSIIYNKTFKSIIEKIVNEELDYSDFPIEYRIYPNKSIGMKWHSDLKLYSKPQYELVFTIDNTSNSKTVWKKKK